MSGVAVAHGQQGAAVPPSPELGIGRNVNGGTAYKISVGRVPVGHSRYRWVYRCEHPRCGGAEHPTTSRDAVKAEQTARDHAERAHQGDHADICVEEEA